VSRRKNRVRVPTRARDRRRKDLSQLRGLKWVYKKKKGEKLKKRTSTSIRREEVKRPLLLGGVSCERVVKKEAEPKPVVCSKRVRPNTSKERWEG